MEILLELQDVARFKNAEALSSYVGLTPGQYALKGEHALMGFRNQDIRKHLFTQPTSLAQRRRQANDISSLLKRLQVRSLIAKIPRSRRWRITPEGHKTLALSLTLYHQHPATKQAA